MKTSLLQVDPEIKKIITLEARRQKEGLEMIPSENYASEAVMEASGSILTNKYSEGYSGKRYYAGNANIDSIETLAIERAKKIFGVPHVNVQPYSGSPANLAVYFALCKPGDCIMGQNLNDGGHLTHGWKVSITGSYFKSIPYHVKADGKIDMAEVENLAKENKPKIIWVGATAYPFIFDYQAFAKIAQRCGAFLIADISHIIGLIVAGVHPSPVEFAHIITSTTHKTLCGPRGAMIMVTDKGVKKDADLAEKIDQAVFPGLQGGPHDQQTAAIAVALLEAGSGAFKVYGKQIVKNAKTLADTLMKNGIKLVGDGTQNHLMVVDLTGITGPGGGILAHETLEICQIYANKNTIPNEPYSPFYPTGLRLGTPALTTRGMKEKEMVKVGELIAGVLKQLKPYRIPQDKNARRQFLANIREEIVDNPVIKRTKEEVIVFCKKFPVPGVT